MIQFQDFLSSYMHYNLDDEKKVDLMNKTSDANSEIYKIAESKY